MRALIFDPFSGISGDMTLGALLDLGLPLEWLRGFVADLRIADVGVGAERCERCGIACTRLTLGLPREHAHRHLADVVAIMEAARLSPTVRDRAVRRLHPAGRGRGGGARHHARAGALPRGGRARRHRGHRRA